MNAKVSLAYTLAKRSVLSRYKGSILGVFWSLLTPIFLLCVYTFVFGTIFKSRWPAATDPSDQSEFAVILFSGLLVFQLFSDVVNASPMIVPAHANYVKKVIFPLEILVPVTLMAALFHLAINTGVLFAAMLIFKGSIPLTAILFPLILVPLCLLILGVGWILSSLGVYLRDIGQIMGTIITAILFTAPIFFPISAMSETVQKLIAFNPLTLPVEQARNALVFGKVPDFLALGQYTVIALIIAVLGYYWFQKTRKGFADVL